MKICGTRKKTIMSTTSLKRLCKQNFHFSSLCFLPIIENQEGSRGRSALPTRSCESPPLQPELKIKKQNSFLSTSSRKKLHLSSITKKTHNRDLLSNKNSKLSPKKINYAYAKDKNYFSLSAQH